MGHLLWYAGVALVAAALATSMRGRPRSRSPGAVLLAVAVGLTWGSNAVGGEGTAVPALLVALAAIWYGWRQRGGLAVLVGVAGAAAAALLGIAATG